MSRERVICFLLAIPALLLTSQAQEVGSKLAKDVVTMWDIEVGMPGGLAIAGLKKYGYSLTKLIPHESSDGEWDVSSGNKDVGSFFVAQGRITNAEIVLYDSLNPPERRPGAFGLADALYWVLHDNGSSQQPDDEFVRDERQTSAILTTREFDLRTPGESLRQVFIAVNGVSFRINIRRSEDATNVVLYRLAPFGKKHQ